MMRGSFLNKRRKLVNLINSEAPSVIGIKDELARLRKEIIDLKTLMIILWAVQVLVFTGLFAGLYLLLLQRFI